MAVSLKQVDASQKKRWLRIPLISAPFVAILLNIIILDMGFGGNAAEGCRITNIPHQETIHTYKQLLATLPLLLFVGVFINKKLIPKIALKKEDAWLIDIDAMTAVSKLIPGYELQFTNEEGYLSVKEVLPYGAARENLKRHYNEGCEKFSAAYREIKGGGDK